MLKVALRGLRAHARRLVLTTVVVLMGVAFVAGGQVITDTVRTSFDEAFTDAYAGTDAVIRSADVAANAFQQQRAPVGDDLLATVRAVPGVRAAMPVVQRPIKVVDPTGEVACFTSVGAPIIGLNWVDDPTLSRWRIVEGRAPSGPDELVMDPKLAADKGFGVGDQVTVPLASGTQVFELVGIASFATTGNFSGASGVLFDTPTAQTELVAPASSDWIAVAAEPGVDQETLRAQLRAAVPADAELQVLTGEAFSDEARSAFEQFFDLINRVLTIFGIVALFVATFVIYNTFSLLITQRARELALLRAVGASRRQVVGSMVIEAFVVGLVAALAGILAGIALGWGVTTLLGNIGFVRPETPLQIRLPAFAPALIVGIGVTLVAALFPAWRGSRIAPVAAMRDVAHDAVRAGRIRTAIGTAVAALGIGLLVWGLAGDLDDPLTIVGIGMGLTFVGVAVLAPVFVGPLTNVLAAPIGRWRGVAGRLARTNAARNPRRSAATVSAVMIGVALVSFIAVIGESLRVSRTAVIDQTVRADYVIDARCAGLSGVSPELAGEVGALDDVRTALGFRIGLGRLDARNQVIIGTDPVALPDVLALDVVDGDLASLQDGAVAVPKELAADQGLQVGTPVVVDFVGVGPRDTTVGAVVDSAFFRGNGILIDQTQFDEVFPATQQTDLQVYVRLADDADRAGAATAIDEVVDRFPPASLQDLAAFTEAQTAPIDRVVFFIWALLLLAVVISIIGVLNTLLLSVYERTRELGLLRAAGMSRRQVRASIRWETVVITLIGTVVGITIGLSFGWTLVRAGADEGFSAFGVPWLQVAIILGVAWVAGLLASLWPARRAARLDVLAAIAHD